MWLSALGLWVVWDGVVWAGGWVVEGGGEGRWRWWGGRGEEERGGARSTWRYAGARSKSRHRHSILSAVTIGWATLVVVLEGGGGARPRDPNCVYPRIVAMVLAEVKVKHLQPVYRGYKAQSHTPVRLSLAEPALTIY